MPNCLICKTQLNHHSAKICKSNQCRSKWKTLRVQIQPDKTANCIICGKTFSDKIIRKKCCSTECSVVARRKTNLDKYGHINTAVSWTNTASEKDLQKAATKRDVRTRAFWKADKASIIEKRNKTNLERYGVVCALSTEKSVVNRLASIERKYGTRSARIASTLKQNSIENYQTFAQDVVSYLEANEIGPYSEAARLYMKETYGCTIGFMVEILARTGRYDLLNKIKSAPENAIKNFLEVDLGIQNIVVNSRPTWMHGKELDFYLPDHNVAIEYHGLATHSERPIWEDKTLSNVKTQHINKYIWCRERGVNLFQIFEDEWFGKHDIILSMIRNRVGKTPRKLFARNCTVDIVPNQQATQFLDNNHVSGHTNSIISFGLFDTNSDNKLVSVISLRKPWSKEFGNVLEISRFASELDTLVVGGFQKLLKRVVKYARDNNFSGIFTYADCRFGSGNVYNQSGFIYKGRTKPNYWYERNGVREARFKHKKSPQLVGATEREQQNNLGWYAIYDAGSERYLLPT